MQNEASGSGSVAEKREQDPELDAWTQRARLKFKKKQYGFQQSKMAATGNADDQTNKDVEVTEEVALHWFRRDLRLHDNEGLLKAKDSCTRLIPLYIFDPHHLDPDKRGSNQLGFLLDTLRSLDNDLKEIGSQLFMAKGNPFEVIESLLNAFKITKLTFGRATQAYSQNMEKAVVELSLTRGVDIESFWSSTLYDPDYLLSLSSGIVSPDLDSFLRLVASAVKPQKPLDPPSDLPPPPPGVVDKVEGIFSKVSRLVDFQEYGYKEEEYTTWFIAGERVAIAQMKNFLADKRLLFGTQEQSKVIARTDPTRSNSEASRLSPYIALGSLSIRLLFLHLKKLERSSGMFIKSLLKRILQCVRMPATLTGVLYCREYAYLLDYVTEGNLQAVMGEETCVCKHISWVRGEEASRMLTRWEMGETGYPAVDACMNQLRHDGWLHNLSRHMAACFLTGGDLMVWWEMGREVFEKYLIDSDMAINNYQWHWISCTAFFSEYFSSFNPVSTFKLFDKHGAYIRTHIPQLKNFPDQYIYEPWRAPEDVQKAAGCVIGRDYPLPMIIHEVAFRRNMRNIQRVAEECRNVVFMLSLRRQSAGADFKIDQHHFDRL